MDEIIVLECIQHSMMIKEAEIEEFPWNENCNFWDPKDVVINVDKLENVWWAEIRPKLQSDGKTRIRLVGLKDNDHWPRVPLSRLMFAAMVFPEGNKWQVMVDEFRKSVQPNTVEIHKVDAQQGPDLVKFRRNVPEACEERSEWTTRKKKHKPVVPMKGKLHVCPAYFLGQDVLSGKFVTGMGWRFKMPNLAKEWGSSLEPRSIEAELESLRKSEALLRQTVRDQLDELKKSEKIEHKQKRKLERLKEKLSVVDDEKSRVQRDLYEKVLAEKASKHANEIDKLRDDLSVEDDKKFQEQRVFYEELLDLEESKRANELKRRKKIEKKLQKRLQRCQKNCEKYKERYKGLAQLVMEITDRKRGEAGPGDTQSMRRESSSGSVTTDGRGSPVLQPGDNRYAKHNDAESDGSVQMVPDSQD